MAIARNDCNTPMEWPKDIRLDAIVYHHTAMHCDSPFEEIVREFDRKGWLTGYHTVVFEDGTSIRVLCRWDRKAMRRRRSTLAWGSAFHGTSRRICRFLLPTLTAGSECLTPPNNQIDAATHPGLRTMAPALWGIKTDFKHSHFSFLISI